MEDLAMYSNVKFRLVRVLHVDDEPTDLEITRIFLRKAAKDNFDIVSVLSAEEALDKLENEYFDVVISDYKMPGMDGIQLLEAIRKNKDYGHIPFILFTGKGGDSVAADALGKGGDKYITKSGDPASQCTELAHVINDLLHLELNGNARWNRDKRPFGVTITEYPFHL
jgi:CheY-like chemotaxis protein